MRCPHCNKKIQFETDDLTPREREVYSYIVAYVAKHATAPTLVEICEKLEINSTGNAHRFLRKIEGKGYVTIGNQRWRGIEVL